MTGVLSQLSLCLVSRLRFERSCGASLDDWRAAQERTAKRMVDVLAARERSAEEALVLAEAAAKKEGQHTETFHRMSPQCLTPCLRSLERKKLKDKVRKKETKDKAKEEKAKARAEMLEKKQQQQERLKQSVESSELKPPAQPQAAKKT